MKGKIYNLKQGNDIIDHCWELISENEDEIQPQLIPPFGSPEIIFYIGNQFQIQNLDHQFGFIKGQFDISTIVNLNPDFHLFGIRLKPYGIKQLFNIDAAELVNETLDVEKNPLSSDILKLIKNAKLIDQDLILEILKRLDVELTYSVSNETITFLQLIKETKEKKISKMIQGSNIKIRNLQRKFLKEVGLSPKKYLRIMKMIEIENQIQKNTDWMEIIEMFDFNDQSHLIKEFKTLRQLSPNNFVSKNLRLSDQLPDPEMEEV